MVEQGLAAIVCASVRPYKAGFPFRRPRSGEPPPPRRRGTPSGAAACSATIIRGRDRADESATGVSVVGGTSMPSTCSSDTHIWSSPRMLARPKRNPLVRCGTRWIGRGGITSTTQRASMASHSGPMRNRSTETLSVSVVESAAASWRVHSSRYSGVASRSNSLCPASENAGQLPHWPASASRGHERSPCTPIRFQHASAGRFSEPGLFVSADIIPSLPARSPRCADGNSPRPPGRGVVGPATACAPRNDNGVDRDRGPYQSSASAARTCPWAWQIDAAKTMAHRRSRCLPRVSGCKLRPPLPIGPRPPPPARPGAFHPAKPAQRWGCQPGPERAVRPRDVRLQKRAAGTDRRRKTPTGLALRRGCRAAWESFADVGGGFQPADVPPDSGKPKANGHSPPKPRNPDAAKMLASAAADQISPSGRNNRRTWSTAVRCASGMEIDQHIAAKDYVKGRLADEKVGL